MSRYRHRIPREREEAAKAAGFASLADYEVYLDDPDGGRHPVRAHLASLGIDPSPVEFPVSAVEAMSWEA